ncbi:MAG: hypothetical protein ACFCBW_10050 [Candidatus Competibacterales bacterium]
MIDQFETSGWVYSAIQPTRVTHRQPILLTLAVDTSYSMSRRLHVCRAAVEALIRGIAEGGEGHQVLLRVLTFADSAQEYQGFLPITHLLERDYTFHPGGGTALIDVTVNALKATADYGSRLGGTGRRVAAALLVVTDGEDTTSKRRDPTTIARVLAQARAKETLSRLETWLVGIGTNNPHLAIGLERFAAEGDFDEFLYGEALTVGNIAQLAHRLLERVRPPLDVALGDA